MLKFEYSKKEWACFVESKTSNLLIGLGDGFTICLYKSQKRSDSFYNQYDEYFDYHGLLNSLTGKSSENKFTPKRIVVIQMI